MQLKYKILLTFTIFITFAVIIYKFTLINTVKLNKKKYADIILTKILNKPTISNNKLSSDKNYFDYIIVGSGPAGLQSAYFLKKYNKKYIILERDSEVGSFFKKYPIHRKLISINKVHTGKSDKEFNLRHDWNSLLSDDESLLFKNYSKDFYPKADVMVEYLNDFYSKNELNISFNTNVIKIKKNYSENKEEYFEVKTSNGSFFSDKLIMASGMFKSHKLKIKNSIPYSELSTDKEKFINKNILIIGQGNSAFETADHLIDTAAIIHMAGRGPLKFAWQTHYVGHLRAVNNNFLDTYQLKTQNGMTGLDDDEIVVNLNGKYYIYDQDEKRWDNQGPSGGYDYVIDCTGFRIDTSIFENLTPKNNGKVPIIKSNFESDNVNNLFFAGVLSQYISYYKSSGAFIHGFRYLIRSMLRIQTNNYHYQIFSNTDKKSIFDKIFYRINNGSGIFQMFGCLVDIIIFYNNKIIYIEELPIKYVEENYLDYFDKILIISLDYGNFGGVITKTKSLGSASYVFGEDRVTGMCPDSAHLSNFLHPILKLYNYKSIKKEFHLSEHLLTEFKLQDIHIDPLKKFIYDL